MSMTVEFYSANPDEFVAIFEADLANDDEDDETFFEQLKAYPVADFSLHLHLPEDFDGLCRLLNEQNSCIPSTFHEAVVDQIWEDEPVATESLSICAHQFVEELAALSEQAIETVAREWTATFSYEGPVQQTYTYCAVWQLKEVAYDAVMHEQSLILHVAG